MSTDLVWLALAMAAVTYPSRALPLLAPGIERMPARLREYLRLVGPAVLMTLAAVQVFVLTDVDRSPTIRLGIEVLAVGAAIALVAAKRGLLVGLIVAAAIAALARANGLG